MAQPTASGAADLVLRNGLLADGRRVDIAVRDGRIARIAPNRQQGAVGVSADGAIPEDLDDNLLPGGDCGGRSSPDEDLGGQLILPSFVDLHMHLDKAFSLELTRNESGTLEEAIQRFGEVHPSLSHQSYVERAERTLRLCLAAGTTSVRTHINTYPPSGTAVQPVDALLEVRERLREVMEIQIVLLPVENIAHDRALYALCEEYLRRGVDALGGAPALDPDPVCMIRATFELAGRLDRAVDLHVDETDDPSVCTLLEVADLTIWNGYQGRVVAGHCCSLAAMDNASAARIVERVAAAGITVVTLPSCNLYLQGRHDRHPVRRGLTRVKDLSAAGVNVAAASDNIRDPFNPFGRGDLLHIADLLAHAAHLGAPHEQALARDAIGANPRACLSRQDPAPLRGGLPREGDPADLVVCATDSADDLIAAQPVRSLVLHGGRIVARTQTSAETAF
jgi:cytosine deaminase